MTLLTPLRPENKKFCKLLNKNLSFTGLSATLNTKKKERSGYVVELLKICSADVLYVKYCMITPSLKIRVYMTCL